MNDKILAYGFYCFVLVAAILATYFLRLPVDFLLGLFGFVGGHAFGAMAPTPTSLPPFVSSTKEQP